MTVIDGIKTIDPAAPEDPQRSGLHRRPAQHVVHGAVHAREESRRPARRRRLSPAPLAAGFAADAELPPALVPASLYPIIDVDLSRPRGIAPLALARACLRGGARLLQLRAKTLAARRFSLWPSAIVATAHGAGAPGHRQRSRRHRAAVGRRRRPRRPGRSAGRGGARHSSGRRASSALSTHAPRPGRAALVDPPSSYVAVGPIFSTTTKETGYEARGLDLVAPCRAAAAGRSSPSAGSRSRRPPTSSRPGAARRGHLRSAVGGDVAGRVRDSSASGARRIKV